MNSERILNILENKEYKEVKRRTDGRTFEIIVNNDGIIVLRYIRWKQEGLLCPMFKKRGDGVFWRLFQKPELKEKFEITLFTPDEEKAIDIFIFRESDEDFKRIKEIYKKIEFDYEEDLRKNREKYF